MVGVGTGVIGGGSLAFVKLPVGGGRRAFFFGGDTGSLGESGLGELGGLGAVAGSGITVIMIDDVGADGDIGQEDVIVGGVSVTSSSGNVQIVFQYFPVFRHKPGVPAVGLDFAVGYQSIRGNIEFDFFVCVSRP